MSVIKNLKFDPVCRRAAAAMAVCVAALILCGMFSDNVIALVIGDIAACVVISLYTCAFAYAVCSALSDEVGGCGEYVLRSGHVFCVSCAAAQAVKLFFLLTQQSGAGLVGCVILIADAAVSWILPMMTLKNCRAAFLASFKDRTVMAANDL